MSNLSDYKKAAQEMANTQPNQASEDKIEEELQAIFDGYSGLIDHEYQGTAYDRTDAINAIKAIIRTEKLKLLAEVRERVVGEGDLVDAEILKKLYDKAYSNGYDDKGYENSYNSRDYRSAEDIAPVIAKIRGGYDKRSAALNKLETEL